MKQNLKKTNNWKYKRKKEIIKIGLIYGQPIFVEIIDKTNCKHCKHLLIEKIEGEFGKISKIYMLGYSNGHTGEGKI